MVIWFCGTLIWHSEVDLLKVHETDGREKEDMLPLVHWFLPKISMFQLVSMQVVLISNK